MASTVKDFADLRKLLTEHPEWREELRQLVLTDRLLALPDLVADLAQAHARAEERLARLEAVVQELAEAQKRTVDVVQRLEEQAARMLIDIGGLQGFRFEQRYATHAAGYLGQWLKRVRCFLPGGFEPETEDRLRSALVKREMNDLLRADILLAGRLLEPPAPDKVDVWLAVEVSTVIDPNDVDWAWRRAGWLHKAGYLAIPVVAGENITAEGTELSQQKDVAVLLNGSGLGWEEAIAAL